MSRSYQVTFWKTKRNASSKKPSYVVRWTVDRKECTKTFGGSELAENFLSDLRQAARRGEWFDTDTGLPESMLKAKNASTWLEFARVYLNIQWPHQAAKTRANTVEALVMVTLALTAARQNRHCFAGRCVTTCSSPKTASQRSATRRPSPHCAGWRALRCR